MVKRTILLLICFCFLLCCFTACNMSSSGDSTETENSDSPATSTHSSKSTDSEASNSNFKDGDPNSKPKDGGSNGKPEDGDSNGKPEDGDPNSKPKDGDPNGKPKDGDSNGKPKDGDSNGKPEDGDSNSNPRTGAEDSNSKNRSADSDTDKSSADSDTDKSSDDSNTDKPSADSDADSTAPDPSMLSNTLMGWWFMRTQDHTQPSAQEEIDLAKYDAWYVKTNLKESEKPVFLTFDCGYENGFTPAILDVLKKHKAPAAFFVCRHFIKDQPGLIKRMKEEGHIVGNHTVNHICMPEKDEREIRKEIADNASYMKETTGYDMDHFFRPPKGEYSERTLQITKNMGYTTVFWSMAYVDYDVNNQPGARYVIEHFNKYIHPGAIPLIHNISRSNAEALDQVLTNLEKEGYTFQSLNELK